MGETGEVMKVGEVDRVVGGCRVPVAVEHCCLGVDGGREECEPRSQRMRPMKRPLSF